MQTVWGTLLGNGKRPLVKLLCGVHVTASACNERQIVQRHGELETLRTEFLAECERARQERFGAHEVATIACPDPEIVQAIDGGTTGEGQCFADGKRTLVELL